MNKFANESWKVPSIKEISIKGALLEHSECWGLNLGSCKYSGQASLKRVYGIRLLKQRASQLKGLNDDNDDDKDDDDDDDDDDDYDGKRTLP